MKDWFTRATSWPVVRRALASALVVGPVLVAVNHGDAIVAGDVSSGRLLQMVATIFVPYAVSTVSSVQAGRSRSLGTAAAPEAQPPRPAATMPPRQPWL